MGRPSLSLHPFALLVARLRDRFLMIEEASSDGWYFPAGGVDPGETFAEAALRETREEAGLDVRLRGIYRVEHRPGATGTRVRVFFAATVDAENEAKAPKAFADEHSLGAAWLTLDELKERTLRGDEVVDVLGAVEAGAHIHPLAVVVEDGRGWAR